MKNSLVQQFPRPVAGFLALALSALLYAGPASAHKLGEGYLFLHVGLDSLHGHVQVTLEDLDKALDLDSDADGKTSVEEVEQRLDDVQAYIRQRVGLATLDADYSLTWHQTRFHRFAEGQYLAYHYFVENPGAVPDEITVRYSLVFDADPRHRGFLVLPTNAKTGEVDSGEETTLGFGPDERERTLNLTSLSRGESFMTFVRHGTWHIWIGIDHILFLLALILPAVLTRREHEWTPIQDFGPALWNVIKIVTLFTIAHTITLSLAAMGIVSLSSRLVESVIAASVVVAAANNIFPILRNKMGWVVFGFGLFHGFGFASVLSHLITNRSNLVVDLLGFNVGVELGQIAVIIVAFPVLFALRKTGFYLRFFLPVGSTVIALLALNWLAERAFEIDLLPI